MTRSSDSTLLKEERRAFRRTAALLHITDFSDVWTRTDLPHESWLDSDDHRAHFRNFIYCVSKSPYMEKLVLKRGHLPRPFSDSTVNYLYEKVTNIDDFFQNNERQLKEKKTVDLNDTSPKNVSVVLLSMALGERCVIRTQDNDDSSGQQGSDTTIYEVYEVLKATQRIYLCHPPHFLFFDRELCINPPTIMREGSMVQLHFRLFKRLRNTQVQPDTDSNNGTWTLVLDTRKNSKENRHIESDSLARNFQLWTTTIGDGTELPGIERALVKCCTTHTKGRLFCGAFFSMGPHHMFPGDDEMILQNWNEFDPPLDFQHYYNLGVRENDDLLFDDFEVVDVQQPLAYWEFTSNDDRLLRSQELKEKANHFMKKEGFKRAHRIYQEAYLILLNNKPTIDPETPPHLIPLALQILANAGLAQMKLKNYTAALYFNDTILAYNPEHLKALYRKAQCLRHLDKVIEATHVINLAIALAPQDPCILQEHKTLRDLSRQEDIHARKALKGLTQTDNWGIAESEEAEAARQYNRFVLGAVDLFTNMPK